MNMYDDPLFNAKQAAYQLGISDSTWWRWLKDGLVETGIFIGRQRKWRQSYINQLKNEGVACSQQVDPMPNRRY